MIPEPRSVEIVLATAGEAPRIAEVHVRARRSAYRHLIPAPLLALESVDDRTARWTERLARPEGRCWLLREQAGLLGFAFTAPTLDEGLARGCAELFALYLLEEAVGLGFGRYLLTHAMEDVEERGFHETVLWYAEENVRAARFYAAAGFEPDPRVPPAPFGETGLTRRRLRRVLRAE